MFVELSRDSSVQLRIKSWSVIPCSIGLFEIVSILELAIDDVFLVESGHGEQIELNDSK